MQHIKFHYSICVKFFFFTDFTRRVAFKTGAYINWLCENIQTIAFFPVLIRNPLTFPLVFLNEKFEMSLYDWNGSLCGTNFYDAHVIDRTLSRQYLKWSEIETFCSSNKILMSRWLANRSIHVFGETPSDLHIKFHLKCVNRTNSPEYSNGLLSPWRSLN